MGVEPKVCFFCVEPKGSKGLGGLFGLLSRCQWSCYDRGHQDGHIATECPRNPESWCYDRSVCCSECSLSPILAKLRRMSSPSLREFPFCSSRYVERERWLFYVVVFDL